MAEPAWIALVPTLCVVAVALALRTTIPALVAGVVVGHLLLDGTGLVGGLADSLVGRLGNRSEAWALTVCGLFGVLIQLLVFTGGADAFGRLVGGRVANGRAALLLAWLLGLIVFIDDYLNALILGRTLRPSRGRAWRPICGSFPSPSTAGSPSCSCRWRRRLSLVTLAEAGCRGLADMVPVLVTLLLAFMLGHVNERLEVAEFVIGALGPSLDHPLLPAAAFVCLSAVSFATGSFWGTYAIALPIMIPLADSSLRVLRRPCRWIPDPRHGRGLGDPFHGCHACEHAVFGPVQRHHEFLCLDDSVPDRQLARLQRHLRERRQVRIQRHPRAPANRHGMGRLRGLCGDDLRQQRGDAKHAGAVSRPSTRPTSRTSGMAPARCGSGCEVATPRLGSSEPSTTWRSGTRCPCRNPSRSPSRRPVAWEA